MSMGSTLLSALFKLPPATCAARSETARIAAPDGIELATDIYRPQPQGIYPTLLMRVPYGRQGFATVAEAYAERGYNVVMQACRGTGGSGGEFDPLSHEREDGLATLAWIERQDWYDGRIGVTGPSYLGYALWAICDALPATAALATKVSSAEFKSVVFPGGSFSLQLWMSWLQTIEGLREAPMEAGFSMFTGEIERRTRRSSLELPLIDADERLTGHRVPFWRHWLSDALDNPDFWKPIDHRSRIGPATPPNHFVSGWYDFMLDQLLRDYQATVAAGQTPHLTIGTWHHIDPELQAESARQTLTWMNAHLKGDPGALRRHPVRIHISGGPGWKDFETYPPQGLSPSTLHLGEGGKLHATPQPGAEPSRYRYDPADPTPNFGGAVFAYTGAGRCDNSKLEARDDVLTFTAPPQAEAVTVIGNPEATLFVRSSLAHADFFVRLCDVSRSGRSTNICDGIIRIGPNDILPDRDGIIRLHIRLHATAHCFRAGHSIRLLVASGAHPRFARNLGTGEPIGTATRMLAADQEVFHGGDHPSILLLPVWPGA